MSDELRTLADDVYDHVAAGFPGLWIESHEHEDACTEIRNLCIENGWIYYQWDVVAGLARVMTDENGQLQLIHVIVEPNPESGGPSLWRIRPKKPTEPPQAELAAVMKGVEVMNCDEGGNKILDDADEVVTSILVLKNIHGFVGAIGAKQLFSNVLWEARANRQVVVGLTHSTDIPTEIEKVFQIIEHPLPDRGQLLDIAKSIATQDGELSEDPDEVDAVVDAASGLTRMEAEDAYSLSLVREEALVPKPVFGLKANMLKKGTGALELYRGNLDFPDVGGNDYVKQFLLETLAHRQENPDFMPKGILLTGVTGAGKSLLGYALGNAVQRPVLKLNVGALMGGVVGETGANTRGMLRKATAMAPCILMIDEVEKALAGVGSSGKTDSGTKAGMFGELLTWMNDRTADVYLIMTSNDITKITEDNPEFARMERFDGIFFVDFPSEEARNQIWDIHLRNYGFLEEGETLDDLDQKLPDTTNMVGAEIKSICRLARLRNRPLVDVAKTIPKVADQAKDTIDAARNWAKGRCMSAEYEELYDPDKHIAAQSAVSTGGSRRVSRKKK